MRERHASRCAVEIRIARMMAVMSGDGGSLDQTVLDARFLSPSDLYQPKLKTFGELFPGSRAHSPD